MEPLHPPVIVVDDADEVRRLRRTLLSFRDFVESCLFHPRWGYYASGAVRFGDGGHYDTYPIALSPYFGRMLASIAFRRWRQWARPAPFEICEIGAGNGQLCLDTLVAVEIGARRGGAWSRFAQALRYRIVEKSAALRRRQAGLLGPLAERVEWEDADLARAPAPVPPRRHGLVIANEVLDCLAHHKVIFDGRGAARVACVGAFRNGGGAALNGRTLLSRRELFAALERRAPPAGIAEFHLPIDAFPDLRAFLDRHGIAGRQWTYFACPEMETLLENLAALYRCADILLVDYGGDRSYHRRAAVGQRLRAGRPEEGASAYRAPGLDDVTFLVDFSVAMNAARACGLQIAFYGGQGQLASMAAVRLDDRAVDLMIQQRALGWLLAAAGVGPEQEQRRSAISWTKPPGRRRPRTLRQETEIAVEEFCGRRRSLFKLLALRRRGPSTSGRRRRAARESER